MHGARIRERLHDGRRTYGTHICSLGNPVVARMTAELELDYVFICAEHMPVDRGEIGMMCQFYAAHGISPAVRIPDPSPTAAAAAIDGGAQGIVAPYVERVEQVRDLVGAVKYRPIKGQFLQDILAGRRTPQPDTRAFLDRFNQQQYLIIGVESETAVNRLDELLNVPGVDGVFIGPHDLSVSLEVPEQYEDARFVTHVVETIACCRRHAVGVGIHTMLLDLTPAVLERYLTAGMNWILNGADISAMAARMRDDLTRLRAMCGDTYERERASGPEVQSCIAPVAPVADGGDSA